jgi:metal-dependent amidase/aminoacylase/carboxypeptidase family protein
MHLDWTKQKTSSIGMLYLQTARSDEKKTDYGFHHPNFTLDETVLPVGVQLHVNLALRVIKELQSGRIFHVEAIEDEL